MKLDDSFWGDAPTTADTGNINLATTVAANPDREAEMQALGKRFGVPTDLVRADYDGFRQKAAILDRKDSAGSPAVQSWVAKSADNAAIAADHDLRVMGRIERTIRGFGEGAVQTVGSSLSGIGHSLDALQRRIIGAAANVVLPKPMAGGEIDPDSLAGPLIGEGWRGAGAPVKQYAKDMGVPDYQKDFADQVVNGIGQVITQIPMAMTPVGWAALFGQGADQLADKVAKDDAPQWKKDLAILGGGAVTSVTEKFALDRWAKLSPLASLKSPLASRAAGIGIATASEGGQEFTENVLQDMLRQQLTNPNAAIDWGDASYSGGVGATVGGIVRSVIEAGLHIKGRHQQQFFQDITEAAKETGLTQRAPEKLADFVQQASEGGPVENVFIPAEAFTRYFQSIGADPAEAAALVGAKNYAEAQAAGTDVVIPLGDFTAKLAPSEHMGPLMPDMRLHQGDLTARELQELQANEEARAEVLKQQYEQLLADGQAATGVNTAIDRVVTDVEGQLLGAGVEPSTARTQAHLMRGVAVLAQRAFPNLNPVEAAEKLWGQYGLTIQRDLPPILAHLKNADVQLDPLLERLRAGAIPKEQEAFGQPLHEFIRALGGVQDQGGEMSARDVDSGNAPFVKNLIQTLGMDFDHARELAAEAGYPVGETESEFIDALGGSIAGSPIYSPQHEDAGNVELMHTLESLDRALKDAGIDLNAVDNATARQLLERAGEVSGARFDQSVKVLPRMMAVHNLSADNLVFADKIGGLAVPSVGVVTEKAGAVDGFGEITLIGTRPLVDPSKERVFSSDAYTARFPSPEWPKAKSKDAQKLVDSIRAIATEYGDRGIIDQTLDYMVNSPDAARVVDAWLSSNAIKAMFLREQGIDIKPVIDPVRLQSGLTVEQFEALRPLYEEARAEEDRRDGSTAKVDELKQAVADALRENYAVLGKREALVDKLIEAATRQVVFTLGKDEHAVRQGPQVNSWETGKLLGEETDRRALDFKRWVEAQVLPNFGEPFLKVKGKKVPYSLDNIVGLMADTKVKGKEKTMTYGAGQVRAAASLEFADLEEMRRAAETSITDPDQYEAAKEKTEKLLEAYRNAAVQFTSLTNWRGEPDTWEALDASMRALAKFSTSKKRDRAAMLAALKAEDFDVVALEAGVPPKRRSYAEEIEAEIMKWRRRAFDMEDNDPRLPQVQEKIAALEKDLEEGKRRDEEAAKPVDVLEMAMEAADGLMRTPVPYFEAKPQRAVRLNEFAGAVIPQNAPPAVRDILAKHGIPVAEYGDRVERDNVVRQFAAELSEGGKATLFQKDSGDKRGFLEIGNDRRMRIGLTENANLSTFLHETGHFYLEMLGDLAANPDASPDVKEDYAAILKWLGVESREQIVTEHHEKFARANEAYLMEGKAPAPELRGPFQRFKAWLTHIYRSLTALDVKLSDEVRGVFDRIYATDQEIEAAKDSVDVAPLFVDAATMGMSEAEFGLYKKFVGEVSQAAQEKLGVKLMREYQRGLQAWWKEERAKVRKEVADEVDAQPVYRAFDALVNGEMDGEAFKLAKTDLVRRYGETYLKNLPRGFQRVYVADGGLDLDTAAEMAGFESGDSLVKALVEMRPKKQLIEAETDQRMAERHGDLMLDGNIADAAREALHNDKRAEVLAIELRALKRKIREVSPFVRQAVGEAKAEAKEKIAAAQAETKDAKAQAKAEQSARVAATDVPAPAVFRRAAAGIIDQMQAKDIQPNAYLIAGRKAAREAFAALARNDAQTAAAAKQRELLNHYLYLEATKAKQESEAIQKYARSFEKAAKRERIGKAGGDYLGQIDALLARYELAKVTLTALSRRQALREFVAAREAEGDIVTIPEELQDESRMVNWREAPMFELRALHDALKNLEHLAAFKNKLLRKRAAIDFAEVKAELLNAIEANIEGSTGERGRLNDKGDTLGDRIRKSALKLDAGLIKVEQLVEWLDGGKIDGPWSRYLFDLADDAQTREYDLHATITQRIQELSESMPKEWGQSLLDKTDVRLPGIDHALTRYDLISIALNAGNQSNYDKLLKGRNWSDAQVQGALSRMTDTDWEYVQGVWDTLESLWPEIAALQKRVAGVEPDKVEPKKIVTASGRKFSGGYFPVVYDPALSRAGEKQDDASESVQDFMARGYGRANTDKGHTKGRIEDFAAPLRLDYEQVLTSHLAKVIKDISHREAILSMNKVLNDGEIKAALIDKLGMDKYQLLATWEQSLISDRADTLHRPLQWYNALFRGLRTHTAIVTMGWKLSTAFSQIAGFAASMDTVNPKYLTTALRDFVVQPREMLALTMEKSGEMRHRAGTIERDVKEQLLKTRGEQGIKAAVHRSAFYLTAMADRVVSVPTWVGGYRQALDAGLSEEDAVRAGDRAVRLSQGAGGAKDLAAVQRNSELMKLLTMYYTPFSVLYARLRDMGHSYKAPADLPRLVARSVALVILPAVLGELLSGRGPDDDEDKTLWAIRKMLLYPFASIPLIRDLANWKLEPELAKLSGGGMQYQPGYKFTPIISAVEKIAGMPDKLIDGWTGARPWDDVAWDELEAAGYLFGLPTAQVRITGEYLYDLFTGQASPADAAEAMHDTLFRRPAERR